MYHFHLLSNPNAVAISIIVDRKIKLSEFDTSYAYKIYLDIYIRI